jgi:uncharacterized protein (TIGR00369 family)
MNQSTVLERLNAMNTNTLMATLGIRYSAAGDGFLEATMPVESRHHQPMGILHGGATAALAESVASAAASLRLGNSGKLPVGTELSINHLRSVRSGSITARAEPIHLGRSTQLWQIDVHDDQKRLIAVAKLSVMLLDPR